MESAFKGASPDGRWVVSVDCELSETGEPIDWVGTVTLDGTHEMERLQTQDSDKLVRWAHRQMVEVMRRTKVGTDGTPAEDAEDAENA